MTDEPLLPCPFCGSAVEVVRKDKLGVFKCPDSSSCKGSWLGSYFSLEHEAEAVAAWNTRPALAAGLGREATRGELHSAIIQEIRKDLERQHPDAFFEDDCITMVIPSGVTPSRAYVQIDISALAEAATYDASPRQPRTEQDVREVLARHENNTVILSPDRAEDGRYLVSRAVAIAAMLEVSAPRASVDRNAVLEDALRKIVAAKQKHYQMVVEPTQVFISRLKTIASDALKSTAKPSTPSEGECTLSSSGHHRRRRLRWRGSR